ncbi:hypothetical protein TNCV_2034541 [Trichonephila clavipes]|nr:hypothetical protein TNCV_2034541 [Trichonephila clavipes]
MKSAIEEVDDLDRQINSEMDSDDVQELQNSHNQELTMDELIEMHEQESESIVCRPSSIRRSTYDVMIRNMEFASTRPSGGVVAAYATMSDRGKRNSLGLVLRLSLAVTLSTMQVAVQFGSVPCKCIAVTD